MTPQQRQELFVDGRLAPDVGVSVVITTTLVLHVGNR